MLRGFVFIVILSRLWVAGVVGSLRGVSRLFGILVLEGFVFLFLLFSYFLSYLVVIQGLPELCSMDYDVSCRSIRLFQLTQEVAEGGEESGTIIIYCDSATCLYS